MTCDIVFECAKVIAAVNGRYQEVFMEEKPQWVSDNNLEATGLYYEGFVDDFESVLSKHRIEHHDNVWDT